jgi:hypothetical protein
MSEEIAIYDGDDLPINLRNIPTDLLIQLLTERNNKDIVALKDQISQINENQYKLQEALIQTQNNLIDYTQATGHVKKLSHSEDYVNKTNLGKNYRLKISPQRISKLLKYCGIEQQLNNEPYSNYLQGVEPLVVREKFVTDYGHEGYTIRYHQERTWNKIYKQMQNDDIYNDFVNCTTVNELNSFIDDLL